MMGETGQYGFYIWAGFGAVACSLLILGISSRMKYNKLSQQFEKLKAAHGDRRDRRVSPSSDIDKGLDNGS